MIILIKSVTRTHVLPPIILCAWYHIFRPTITFIVIISTTLIISNLVFSFCNIVFLSSGQHNLDKKINVLTPQLVICGAYAIIINIISDVMKLNQVLNPCAIYYHKINVIGRIYLVILVNENVIVLNFLNWYEW